MSWTNDLKVNRQLSLKASVISLTIFSFLFICGVRSANAQAIAEGFDLT